MDPNDTLSTIRCLVTVYFNGGKWPEPDATDLARAIRDLDEWLSKGGFLPAAWDRALTPPE